MIQRLQAALESAANQLARSEYRERAALDEARLLAERLDHSEVGALASAKQRCCNICDHPGLLVVVLSLARPHVDGNKPNG